MQMNPSGRCEAAIATPEYLRVDQAVRLFSIGRSTLYTLLTNGSVTSRVIKTSRHNVSGIRLISTDSLRAFIESSGQEATKPEGQSA